MSAWSANAETARSGAGACPVCGGMLATWATIAGYRHDKCRACSSVSVVPRPTPEELAAYYGDGRFYDAAENERTRLVREATARVEALEAIARRFGLGRRLLDVGSATGIFLDRAAANGWDVAGVELSGDLARRSPLWEAGRIRVGRLEDAPPDWGDFDVVTSWEVIEHVPDPATFLAGLAARVRPGGLLALSTPRADGLPGRLLGRRFPMYCPPEHLTLFSRRGLERLARGFGLRPIEYRSFSNLEVANIASGIARLGFGRPVGDLAPVWGTIVTGIARLAQGIPTLVDRAGYGTEMEIHFRRGDS